MQQHYIENEILIEKESPQTLDIPTTEKIEAMEKSARDILKIVEGNPTPLGKCMLKAVADMYVEMVDKALGAEKR